jgi:hypothetical protein
MKQNKNRKEQERTEQNRKGKENEKKVIKRRLEGGTGAHGGIPAQTRIYEVRKEKKSEVK